jgi:hypothetical protein
MTRDAQQLDIFEPPSYSFLALVLFGLGPFF